MEHHAHHPSHEDPFRPPTIPVAVMCLHCGSEYESSRLEWRELPCGDHSHGCWCCPTADCQGSGFGFDVLPSDPAYYEDIDAWYALADESAGEQTEEAQAEGAQFEETWDDDGCEEDLWQEAEFLSEATTPAEEVPVAAKSAPLPWLGAGRDAPPEAGFKLRLFVPEDE